MIEERIDWPNGEKIALSVVVNVEEGSEMSITRGDAGMEPLDELGIFMKGELRNYGNESNYRYGIKAGAARIVKLLRDYDIRASWTAAAVALEERPRSPPPFANWGTRRSATAGAGSTSSRWTRTPNATSSRRQWRRSKRRRGRALMDGSAAISIPTTPADC